MAKDSAGVIPAGPAPPDVPSAITPAVGREGVRPDWCFRVIEALQRAVGDCGCPEPAHFQAALHRAAQRLEPPAAHPERLFLADRLRVFALCAGRSLHAGWHMQVPGSRCDSVALERVDRVWEEWPSVDPRSLLTVWAAAYVARVADTHDRPPELRSP